jgi:hypothetical protein
LSENNEIRNEDFIIAKRFFYGLPYIVQAEDDKIYQISYYDSMGRFRPFKEIKPKIHKGCEYYRIDGVRYSIYKLQSISEKKIKKIELNKIKK